MAAKPKKARGAESEHFKTSGTDLPPSTGPFGESVAEQLAGLDVRAQSALLHKAFEAREPVSPDEPETRSRPQRRAIVQRIASQVSKSVLGLALVIIAGVGPIYRLLEWSSVEAVVNARLITLRAPIDGRLADAELVPTIGAAIPKGQMILRMSNGRTDRARLDDLQRRIDQAESDRPALAMRLARLKDIHEQISSQARAFQAGRVRELEERVLDLKAQADATEASESEAASTLGRTRALAGSGYQTAVALERAERDAKVARQTKRSLDHRLFASVVELEAARRGEYVGDSYNDRPSSLQHADELSVRIAETEAELQSRQQRLSSLRAAFQAESLRHTELSNAELGAPADARVWEVLVSPGEEVRKGQDLLRLLDCSGTVVTATVRESVFNRLQLGDKAQFRFSEHPGKYEGTVVRMSGIAAPADNLAIPQAGVSGGYRVIVSVPDLASTQCGVGRTGTVVFGGGGVLQSLRGALSFFLLGA